MAFKDYTDFAAGDLELPYRGKVYTIPQPSMELGLRLVKDLGDPTSDLSKMDIADFWPLLLGDAYPVMLADKVPLAFVTRCAMTALADFQYGREYAEATWEAGTDPKALEAYMTSLTEENPAETETLTAEETSTP